jgi:hypothetical protein
MIAALILIAHAAVAVYAFAHYRKEGMGEGLLAVAFVVVVFSVGWTISTMLAKIVFPTDLAAHWISNLQGSATSRIIAKELTTDTFSLVLLACIEGVFYYFYLRSERMDGGKNKRADRPKM